MRQRAKFVEAPEFMEFLKTKCQTSDKPLSMRAIAQDFIDMTGSKTSKSTLVNRIAQYRNILLETPRTDIASKVKEIFVLSVPISKQFVDELQQNAEVTVDNGNCITKYVSRDGSLTFQRTHLHYVRGKDITGANKKTGNVDENRRLDEKFPELSALINFVIAKCQTSDQPLSILGTVAEFIEQTKSTTKDETLMSWLITLRQNIFNSPEFDLNTKIMLNYGLSGSVPPASLDELLRKAEISLDDKRRIIKYVSKDGSLTLEGTHPSAKNSNARVSKIVKSVELATKIANTKQTASAVKTPQPETGKELDMLIDEVVQKMTEEVGKPVICQQNRQFFVTPELGCPPHQQKMDSGPIRANTTIHRENMRKRRSDLTNAFREIKEVLIEKGIKSKYELSTQEKILFAIVEFINSEDLNQLFPPLVRNGTWTAEDQRLYDQQRREKHNVAYSRIKEFLVNNGGIKRPLRPIDVLEATLQFIKNKPPNVSALPVPPTNTKFLTNVSESSVNPELFSQPPVTSLLKHSVDSMLTGSLKHSMDFILKGPRQVDPKPEPVLFQPMNQIDFQAYNSYFTPFNTLVQNQMLSPMENKENGSGSFVFGSSNKFQM